MIAGLGIVAGQAAESSDAPARGSGAPVLVELFTSEGCSSCPPADRLLQELDRSQPVAGAQAIVLSEHVDYWNHLGWKDPYSSSFFSERQNAYAGRFELGGPYTPQMVVDGNAEFVGSDSRQASQAIEKARVNEKVPVRISAISWENAGALRAHVEAGPLSNSVHAAEIFLVIALNHAESQVSRGENDGRHLTHVAVVQSITKVGSLDKRKNFSQDIQLKPNPGADPANLRVIAFVQEPRQGKVLGAALQIVGK